ncbi:MAG: hypothetical protein NTW21_08295 [Verrucomicrobia bacterium]|nr:hypothetical protein [Verrucomicrobiota bacterium]
MSTRFQIEDIVAQSALGVVFRATDGQTGKPVALRRFFPAGAGGGGLGPEDQVAFRSVISRLLGVSHPALRAVVAGGCDPVDAMPFVVTEWVDGHSLAELMKHGRLMPQQAVLVLATALEVSAVLSQALDQEAVWVDTSLSSIMVDNAASGRGATFRISSSQCSDGDALQCNLQAILQLAEDLLGWRGRPPGDTAGSGLGQWFIWLRAHAGSASIAEARARLEALPADLDNPPEPAAQPAENAAPPETTKVVVASRAFPLLLAGVAALAVAAVGWWWFTHRPQPLPRTVRTTAPASGANALPAPGAAMPSPPPHGKPPPAPAMAASPAPDPGVAAANALAAAMQEELQRQHAERRPLQGMRPQTARADPVLSVFAPAQIEALMAIRNQEVIVEGVLVAVVAARSGRHLYLEFSKPGPPYVTRGILPVAGPEQTATMAAINAWVGKRVRMFGTVEIERFRDGAQPVARPKIPLRGLDAVMLME